jgi:hypothetical protein
MEVSFVVEGFLTSKVTWGLHFMKKFVNSVVLCSIIGSGFVGTVQPTVYDEIISDAGVMSEASKLNFLADGVVFSICLVMAQQNKDDSVVTINLNRMAEKMVQRDILNSIEETVSSFITTSADDVSAIGLQTSLSRATRYLKGSLNDKSLQGGRLKAIFVPKDEVTLFLKGLYDSWTQLNTGTKKITDASSQVTLSTLLMLSIFTNYGVSVPATEEQVKEANVSTNLIKVTDLVSKLTTEFNGKVLSSLLGEGSDLCDRLSTQYTKNDDKALGEAFGWGSDFTKVLKRKYAKGSTDSAQEEQLLEMLKMQGLDKAYLNKDDIDLLLKKILTVWDGIASEEYGVEDADSENASEWDTVYLEKLIAYVRKEKNDDVKRELSRKQLEQEIKQMFGEDNQKVINLEERLAQYYGESVSKKSGRAKFAARKKAAVEKKPRRKPTKKEPKVVVKKEQDRSSANRVYSNKSVSYEKGKESAVKAAIYERDFFDIVKEDLERDFLKNTPVGNSKEETEKLIELVKKHKKTKTYLKDGVERLMQRKARKEKGVKVTDKEAFSTRYKKEYCDYLEGLGWNTAGDERFHALTKLPSNTTELRDLVADIYERFNDFELETLSDKDVHQRVKDKLKEDGYSVSGINARLNSVINEFIK